MKHSNIENRFYIPVEEFVSWKKSMGVYSFQYLPPTVIIVSGLSFIRGLKIFFHKKLQGLNGENFLINKILVTQKLGNGAPALLTHLEELRVLGVKNYLFFGWAGIINPEIESGEIFLIEKSDFTAKQEFYPDSKYQNNINPLFLELKHNLGFKSASCVSKDLPFYTGKKYNKEIFKYDLTDMETAAFHSFLRHYKLNGAALLTGADYYKNGKWIPPDNMQKMIEKQHNYIKAILNFLK